MDLFPFALSLSKGLRAWHQASTGSARTEVYLDLTLD